MYSLSLTAFLGGKESGLVLFTGDRAMLKPNVRNNVGVVTVPTRNQAL